MRTTKNYVLGRIQMVNKTLKNNVVVLSKLDGGRWEVELYDDRTGRPERTLRTGTLSEVCLFVDGLIERQYMD